jgi:signal transduction histidine kinase
LRAVVNTVVGVLLVAVVLSAVVTAVARFAVRGEVEEVQSRLLPARAATKELAAVHQDQTTVLRGYLLGGDEEFLDRWDALPAEGESARNRLAALLDDDQQGMDLLAAAAAEEAAWRRDHAQPAIDASPGTGRTVTADRELLPEAEEAHAAVREADDALLEHVEGRLAAGFDRIATWQGVADAAAFSAVGVAVGAACFTVLFLRRRLTRPLERLLEQVQGVAEGPSEAPVVADGPEELRRIGEAVEQMRQRLLESADQLVETQRRLAVVQERDRLAADIHDLVIQRVFGLGLSLSAELARHPEHAARLDPLIEETDQVIQSLRRVIFDIRRPRLPGGGLRDAATGLVHESSRALGFAPEVTFVGPVDLAVDDDLAHDLLAVLRETLSNVARHAHADAARVTVAAHDGRVGLVVSDTGTTPWRGGDRPGHGLDNLRQRAERRGGECHVEGTRSGTTVAWWVPLTAPRPAVGSE